LLILNCSFERFWLKNIINQCIDVGSYWLFDKPLNHKMCVKRNFFNVLINQQDKVPFLRPVHIFPNPILKVSLHGLPRLFSPKKFLEIVIIFSMNLCSHLCWMMNIFAKYFLLLF
jgi:hypothetical protein